MLISINFSSINDEDEKVASLFGINLINNRNE